MAALLLGATLHRNETTFHLRLTPRNGLVVSPRRGWPRVKGCPFGELKVRLRAPDGERRSGWSASRTSSARRACWRPWPSWASTPGRCSAAALPSNPYRHHRWLVKRTPDKTIVNAIPEEGDQDHLFWEEWYAEGGRTHHHVLSRWAPARYDADLPGPGPRRRAPTALVRQALVRDRRCGHAGLAAPEVTRGVSLPWADRGQDLRHHPGRADLRVVGGPGAGLALLDQYAEAGGNYVDAADSYNKGESERIVGRWVKDRGVRDRMLLGTKVFFPTGSSPNDARPEPEAHPAVARGEPAPAGHGRTSICTSCTASTA